MSKRSEMLALTQLLVDETATTEQAERLSCLLREDAVLRQEYCEFVETHSALCWLHRDASSPEDTHLVRPSTESHRQRRTPYRTTTLLSVAIAIAVLCGFFALRQRNDSEANRRARRVVSAALNAHRDSKEYRYRVVVTWGNALQNSLQGHREICVSTRGNEFWIDVAGRQRFAIGQSPDQSAWVALNENVGLRIGSEEMGPVLQDLLELHSLRLESLLQGVLRDHRLKHVDGDKSVDVIVAEPTRLVGWIRKVRFEVDRVFRKDRRYGSHRKIAASGPLQGRLRSRRHTHAGSGKVSLGAAPGANGRDPVARSTAGRTASGPSANAWNGDPRLARRAFRQRVHLRHPIAPSTVHLPANEGILCEHCAPGSLEF